MEYHLQRLQNGLRFLHQPSLIKGITHCCLFIQSGSRDEPEHKTGIAHFTEHMLFKGTLKKTNRQILNRLEVVGGEINAYTTKEYTCLHASFLDRYTARAFELMSDMALRSTFPPKEIEREKGVIGDEIDSYQDIPEEFIQDDFDALVFEGHSLGNNILGTKETIATFTAGDLTQYTQANFLPGAMVLGVFSSLEPKTLMKWAQAYFGQFESSGSPALRSPYRAAPPRQKVVKAPIHQVHGILGGTTFSSQDPQRMTMLLLMNLLGGPGMSSRLNMEIREKRGICYQIEAGYVPFSDIGQFSIYFGTDPEKYPRCLRLIYKELEKLQGDAFSVVALHQAKARFKGQIALADENHPAVLMALCKSIQDYGHADSLEEIYRQIDTISSRDILEVSNLHFHQDQLSSLIIVPQD